MITAPRRTGEFLVGGIFDDTTTVENMFADPTISMASGTPVAVRATDKAVVVWDDSQPAGSGNEVFYGFLYSPTYAQANAANSFVPVSVVAHPPQAIQPDHGRVPLLGGITRAKLVAAAQAKGFTIYPG